MSERLRLGPSVTVKERQLERLLAERGLRRDDAALAEIVADAQLLGSLELAGRTFTWDEVRSSRVTGAGHAEILALRRAMGAVAAAAPLSVAAIRAWHEALAGPAGFRHGDYQREGAPVAAPEFIESRLASLAEWLATAGTRDLRPEQAASLALARLAEIRPFDDANGRVSRLAAAHVLVRAGERAPILVAGDAARLRAATEAAFRFETEPLVTLLVEASARALDVMIQSLERRLV
jgi:Fic family protein